MQQRQTALLFIAFLFPSLVFADAWSNLREPLAVDSSWREWPMQDATFDRYAYPIVGADFAVWFDPWYPPNPGDTWQIRLSDLSDAIVGATYTLRYDEASDCLIDNFGVLGCGVMAAVEDDRVFYRRYTVYFSGRCLTEATWGMAGTYNGSYIGNSPYAFTPVDFKPGKPEVSLTSARINPRVPESQDGDFLRSADPGMEPGKVDFEIRVRDDLGCNRLLDDELIEVKARIAPQSGSHRHFAEEDMPGTGKLHFQDLRPFIANEDATLQFQMIYETEKLSYTAGVYGVNERLSVEALEARSPAVTETDVEITTAAMLGEMVALDGQGDWYDVRGTGGACDTAHNTSTTIRNSDYLLPHVRNLTTALAHDFFDRTGLRLSFNAKCHATHRLGIDVDVNGTPMNPGVCLAGTGPRLENCQITLDNYPEPKRALRFLDQLAEDTYAAHYWRQHDREVSPLKIHYRFPR